MLLTWVVNRAQPDPSVDAACRILETTHVVTSIHLWCALCTDVAMSPAHCPSSYHYLVTDYFKPEAVVLNVWYVSLITTVIFLT